MLRKANNKGKLKYGAFRAVKHLLKLVKNLKRLSQIHEYQEQANPALDKSTALIFEKITNQILKLNKKVDLNVL